jgi:low affinity Fe/Cu permease
MPHDNIFSRFASAVTRWTGSTWAFIAALAIIAAWGLIGPLFHYSDTWQLVINTGTTIVTFVMVFLIQRARRTQFYSRGSTKERSSRSREVRSCYVQATQRDQAPVPPPQRLSPHLVAVRQT